MKSAIISKFKKKVMPGLMSAMTTLMIPSIAMAVTINTNLNPITVFSNIVDFIITVAIWIGAAVTVFAGIAFGFAFSQENPDQQARALKYIFGGLICLGISSVLKLIGVIV